MGALSGLMQWQLNLELLKERMCGLGPQLEGGVLELQFDHLEQRWCCLLNQRMWRKKHCFGVVS